MPRIRHATFFAPFAVAGAAFICTAALLAPAYAQKTAAAPFITEAKKLLPTVGMDLNPGDGGPDAGKLTYQSLLPLYARLARAQRLSGDEAGAKATYARGMALCTQKKGTYQALTGVIVAEGLRTGFADPAIAFSDLHNTDGYRAPFIAAYQAGILKNPKAATATLLAGVQKVKEQKEGDGDLADCQATLFRILTVAKRYNLADAATAAREVFASFVEKLDGIDRCEAFRLSVPEVTAADAEAKLREQAAGDPGMLAIGLLFLGKDTEATAALANIKPGGKMPPGLALQLRPADFAAAVRRSKNSGAVITAMLYLKQEGLETPPTIFALSETLESLAPGEIYPEAARLVSDAALLVPDAQTQTPALRKHAALLKADFLKQEAYYSAHPAQKDSDDLSERQNSRAESLIDIAPFDPAFVTRHLAKVTEPRRRIGVLVALSLACARG